MTGKERFQTLLEKLTRQVASNKLQSSVVDIVNELDACALRACPKTLFRFRGTSNIDSEIGDIERGVLFLPRASGFNDVKDAVAFVEKEAMLRQVEEQLTKENAVAFLQGLIDSCPFPEERIQIALNLRMLKQDFESRYEWFVNHLKDTHHNRCHEFRNSFRIACFTEDLNSTYMWGHYADSGAGYAVEYSIPKQTMIRCSCRNRCCLSGNDLIPIFPVIYGTQFDSTSLSHIVMSEYPSPHYPTPADYLVQVNTLVRKTANWAEEKEWRLVCSDCDQDSQRECENTMYANLPAKALYIGYSASFETKSQLLALSRECSIPAFQTKEDTSSLNSAFTFERLL